MTTSGDLIGLFDEPAHSIKQAPTEPWLGNGDRRLCLRCTAFLDFLVSACRVFHINLERKLDTPQALGAITHAYDTASDTR